MMILLRGAAVPMLTIEPVVAQWLERPSRFEIYVYISLAGTICCESVGFINLVASAAFSMSR